MLYEQQQQRNAYRRRHAQSESVADNGQFNEETKQSPYHLVTDDQGRVVTECWGL
jgi:hypothetical protein